MRMARCGWISLGSAAMSQRSAVAGDLGHRHDKMACAGDPHVPWPDASGRRARCFRRPGRHREKGYKHVRPISTAGNWRCGRARRTRQRACSSWQRATARKTSSNGLLPTRNLRRWERRLERAVGRANWMPSRSRMGGVSPRAVPRAAPDPRFAANGRVGAGYKFLSAFPQSTAVVGNPSPRYAACGPRPWVI